MGGKKILLTGASGFLGSNYCKRFAGEYEIYGLYSTHHFNMQGIEAIQSDLTDADALARLMDQIQPEAVIHLAALSQPNDCEKQPELSYNINVQATVNLGRACVQRNIPMVFSSTDLVFDGMKPPYSEADPTNPINLYGRHKLEAEEKLLAIHPGAVVCRLPLMYGGAYAHGISFIQPLLERLGKGEQVTLFSDEIRTVADGISICDGMMLALEKGAGILHLGGPESLSRIEMGRIICRALGYDEVLLKPVLQSSVQMAAARPADVSLCSDKMYDLGWKPDTMEAGIRKMVIQMQ